MIVGMRRTTPHDLARHLRRTARAAFPGTAFAALVRSPVPGVMLRWHGGPTLPEVAGAVRAVSRFGVPLCFERHP